MWNVSGLNPTLICSFFFENYLLGELHFVVLNCLASECSYAGIILEHIFRGEDQDFLIERG